RYGYVSDGLIIYEGDVGDLFVLHHAGSTSISSSTPTATPTTVPTLTATPVSTPTTTTSGPLSVGSLSASSTNVAQYDKLELTFPITGSVATNLQFPYDPVGAPGQAPGQG